MIAALATAAMLVLAPADLVEPPPLAELSAPVEANTPAVRIDPPPAPPSTEALPGPPAGSSASAGGRCVGWEPLLAEYSPGWSVERMSRIMWRESRCQPAADNRHSSATGLLQILSSHCRWLAARMGEWCSAGRLTDADYNVRAAAALWLEQGYRAWSTS